MLSVRDTHSRRRGKLFVGATRFSEETWRENRRWRAERGKRGCLYPLMRSLSSTVPADAAVLVIEMNNTLNRVEGLGLVVNERANLSLFVYGDALYNRRVYKSAYRRDRQEIIARKNGQHLLDRLEMLCFTGHDHIKRATGITLLPQRWMSPDLARWLAEALSCAAL